jgi:ketosteroid isomerase-like protein
MLPPNGPPVVGKDAIREVLSVFISPDFQVRHDMDEVVVSLGGDLSYVSYSYELTFTGPEGTPVTEAGKDISIYKKDADGSWKLAIDMWSSNETAEIHGGES